MFSKACEYGIRAVLYISLHADEEAKAGIREIAKELDIPEHFLAKIMQQLSGRELVSSVKGPNGGFYLSPSQRKKPLLKVVEAIDGLGVFKQCGLGLSRCSDTQPCPLHNEFKKYRDGIRQLLNSRTINELAVDLSLQKFYL